MTSVIITLRQRQSVRCRTQSEKPLFLRGIPAGWQCDYGRGEGAGKMIARSAEQKTGNATGSRRASGAITVRLCVTVQITMRRWETMIMLTKARDRSTQAPWSFPTRRRDMERNGHQFTFAAARALAAAVLVAGIAFASGPAFSAKAPGKDRVEARIDSMHAKLKITAAQEEQWAKVIQVMRDNEKAIEPLIKARAANAKTMNAVDELKSYGEITDVHADGIKKFTPVFAALYDSMSDAQKKQADILFRPRDHRHAKSK
jgi:protein CpxP